MSRTHRALAMLALSLALVGATTAVAAAQPAIEDQNDRLLRNLQATRAERAQAAVQQVRAGERNLTPVPAVTVAPAPTAPVVPTPDVDVLATLLFGLIGGWSAVARPWPAGRPPAAAAHTGRSPPSDLAVPRRSVAVAVAGRR
jgi:hypothetical protein